eukprot:TRINITY_DN4534_c0_g2_i1.p1 TRINITY_DN4534_c0_g2~~TRINITY_DN4534_c0_g2_i1.p1  ORF type:complete len:164 (-),score=19.80 TRINITY_DN4534_c0_g2_i1:94-585(-)
MCQIIKWMKMMDARIVLSWPTFCDRPYDMCQRTPGQPAGRHLCTRVFCFFHPGVSCNERGAPARCKSLAWMKQNGIQCPIPCRSLFKKRAMVSEVLSKVKTNGEKRSGGSLQLSSRRGNKRAMCSNADCGSCGVTDDIMTNCRGRNPISNAEVCCSCALQWFD